MSFYKRLTFRFILTIVVVLLFNQKNLRTALEQLKDDFSENETSSASSSEEPSFVPVSKTA